MFLISKGAAIEDKNANGDTPLWPGSPNWPSSYVSPGTRLQDRSFSVRLSQYADLFFRRPAFALHSSDSLVKVRRLTPFMGQFYEAQPPRRPRMGKEIRPGVAQTPAETQPGPVEEAGAACPTML